MLKFFLVSIQFIFLFSLTFFLISNSFNVSFDIGDLTYSFSSNFLVIILLLLVIMIAFMNFVYFRTKFVFEKYSFSKKIKRTEKGYNYFADAMIALLNKDNKTATISGKKMKNFFKEEATLNLVLQSEILKIEKKSDELTEIYDLMIKNSKTKTLGYRGLMEQSLKQQDYHHAFIYGEKLFFLNPKIEKLYETLVSIIAKTRNWNQLIVITEKAFSNKIIKKEEVYENKSIAFFETAKIKMNSDINEGIKLIEKAISFKKNFPPYIKLYLEILFKERNTNKIKKILKKYWNQNPNSALRLSITDVLKKNKINEIDFVKNIIDKNSNNEESKKLLIDFAIYLNEWSLARNNIKGLIGTNPSREICLFMSEIELGEFNDIQKSEAWKIRANNAIPDNYWVCKITNTSQKNWSALSEAGHFNSLEWRQPKMLSVTQL